MTDLPFTTTHSQVTPDVVAPASRWSGICWGSVLSGTVVAMASMITLGELCSGMGWTMLRPLANGDSSTSPGTLAAAGVVAWIVCGIISFFLGGWVAGHAARRINQTDNTIHGVLVWAVGAVLMVAAAATVVGGVMGGALSLTGSVAHGAGAAIGGTASGAGTALGSAAGSATGVAAASPTFSWDSIKEQAQDLFATRDGAASSTGGSSDQSPTGAAAAAPGGQAGQPGQSPSPATATTASPTAGTHALMGTISRMFGSSDSNRTDADRQKLEDALVSQGHLSRDQAHAQVQQWEQDAQAAKQKYDDAKAAATQKVKEAADAAAKFASLASFLAFVATALGFSAAALGGHVGGMTSHRSLSALRSTDRGTAGMRTGIPST